MLSQKVLLLAHDSHFGIYKRSTCMSFFVMPYSFTVVGRFKMVQSTMPLSSIAPYTRLPDGGQVCTFLKRP
jgi:hypothetical protein